jgi:hypothetical protein
MEPVHSPEMSALIYLATWHCISENSDLGTHFHESLKSQNEESLMVDVSLF